MKLTFEIQGYSITIEETEEGVLVAATKDDETVEEFTLELGGEDDDFDGEDDDFDGEDDLEGDDDLEGQGQIQGQAQGQALPSGEEDEFQPPIGESKLESFTSFIKKRG